MKVTWRKQQYPGPILEQFDPSRFTRGPKGVSYKLISYGDIDRAASTLLSFIDFSGSTASTEEQLGAVVRTIMEAGVKNQLNPRFFLSELGRRLTLLENRKKNKYVVIGHVSIANSLDPIAKRCIKGVHISIGSNIERYTQGRNSIAAHDRILQDTPSTYTSIKLTISARSEDEAFSQSERAWSLLLGWWNHALTYGRSRLFLGGRPGPVAEIVLSPLRPLLYISTTIQTQQILGSPTTGRTNSE